MHKKIVMIDIITVVIQISIRSTVLSTTTTVEPLHVEDLHAAHHQENLHGL